MFFVEPSIIGDILKKFILYLECFLIISTGLLILNGDRFQEKICPQGYWEGQVKKYNNNVSLNSYKIHELELNILKEKDILNYDLQALAHKALRTECSKKWSFIT